MLESPPQSPHNSLRRSRYRADGNHGTLGRQLITRLQASEDHVVPSTRVDELDAATTCHAAAIEAALASLHVAATSAIHDSRPDYTQRPRTQWLQMGVCGSCVDAASYGLLPSSRILTRTLVGAGDFLALLRVWLGV